MKTAAAFFLLLLTNNTNYIVVKIFWLQVCRVRSTWDTIVWCISQKSLYSIVSISTIGMICCEAEDDNTFRDFG